MRSAAPALNAPVTALSVTITRSIINPANRMHPLTYVNSAAFRCMILIAAVAALPACDSGESTANSGEKWLEAPDALNNYRLTANNQTMESGSGSADTGCETIIEDIRESLIINPGSSELQVIVSPCSDAGLKFGKAIRCKLGRLQVKCL
jgi:hypothetical protein